MLFESPGKENTELTVAIAVEKALELQCDLVISSNRGESADALLRAAKATGFTGKIVVVRAASSAANGGVNAMTPERKADLEARGASIVTAAHALSAGERGISSKFQGAYPLEIMAHTLRTFGQGMKVCFECAVMALDADAISYGVPVVSIGGTGQGVDTAVVITPSYSSSILETKVHEILCKPQL